MTFFRSLLILSALAFPCGAFAQTSPAPAQDDPALDTKAVTQQLQALMQSRTRQKNQFLENVRQQVAHVAQNSGAAGNFAIECYRKVQFDGRGGGNDYTKWRKENPDIGSSREVEVAANLHLRYLALTLQRAQLDSAGPLQQDLWSYLDAMTKAQGTLADLYREPKKVKMKIFDPKQLKVTGEIVGSIDNYLDPGAEREQQRANIRSFAQNLLNDGVDHGWPGSALNVGGYLSGISNWEMAPGNFSGIIEQDVRAYLREKKDPRIVSTWDFEIAYLGNDAKLKKDEKALKEFNELMLPRMLWNKAKDMELVGMPNRALELKLNLLKQYASHPDFEQWADEVQGQLKSTPATVPSPAKAPTGWEDDTGTPASSPAQ
jgi:hypothetical protein